MKQTLLNDLMNVQRENIFKLSKNLYLININNNTYKIKLNQFNIHIQEIIYDSPAYEIRIWRSIDPIYRTIVDYFKEDLNIYYNSEE